jgi:hypothetical protein
MNRKNLLLLASLSFAALPACSNNGSGDGGTSTSAGSSTGAANNGGSTGTANNGGSTGTANNGGSTGAVSSSSGGSSSGGSTGGFPAAPVLGTQIDRAGRPAINTALTDPYNLLGVAPDAGYTEDQAKNAYNSAAGGIAQWTAPDGGGFIPWISQNLAIADALDGVCGNQAFASPPDAGVGAYGTLGTVLADDELYIDTTTDVTEPGGCSFLGAELELTGFITGGNISVNCGGRQPTEDVIDVEYNALAFGLTDLLQGQFEISNGVTAKGLCSNPSNDDSAPYLGAPNTSDGGPCADGGN